MVLTRIGVVETFVMAIAEITGEGCRQGNEGRARGEEDFDGGGYTGTVRNIYRVMNAKNKGVPTVRSSILKSMAHSFVNGGQECEQMRVSEPL